MVAGYFSKRTTEFRMAQGPDALGIQWEGAVMEGRMTVEQRFLQEKREVFLRQMEVERREGVGREFQPGVGGRPG